MASIDRVDSLKSVPPPPPPMEDSNFALSNSYGVDTYTNNMMADDESVEAQHVVYTFAEEGKSSKAGRKKWICLMLSIASLLIAIIALGSVYGSQRRSRQSQIAQANEAATAAANLTDLNATEPVTLPEEDLYVTPTNETLANVTLSGNETSSNVTEPEEEFTETEPPTTWTTNFFGQRIFPSDVPRPFNTEAPFTLPPSAVGTVRGSQRASDGGSAPGTDAVSVPWSQPWRPQQWGNQGNWGQPAFSRDGPQSF
mmetsp:Transcript_5906/g.14275  ORF Transcript_5906/g.14275 Transcript_5906/m.14275 type:complete len:255 (-) Transcript_5906:242-1006(-)|eukprot:CAMPEP_0116090720 /NCGR_PEP_ID=MMETSP0327-20121206/7121_1 /TAXON_ID=44447 /ORGANISM="Pseudo-nitzschia delicatissima, Strain B596" /LENGTH=254 /DNA_ID=CAMNT_0003582021 /DNA_START=120 /DNA_END=884 /DNA_ORIENTATION=-